MALFDLLRYPTHTTLYYEDLDGIPEKILNLWISDCKEYLNIRWENLSEMIEKLGYKKTLKLMINHRFSVDGTNETEAEKIGKDLTEKLKYRILKYEN